MAPKAPPPHRRCPTGVWHSRERRRGYREGRYLKAYLAIPNFDFRNSGFFGPGHFRYDTQGNHYVCPAGQILRFQKKTTATGAIIGSGAGPRSAKRLHAYKAKCTTTSERGRVL